MASLAELQAAFNAAEAKRGAELRRLRAAADGKAREAAALRAALEQRAADMRRLAQQQQGTRDAQQAAVAAPRPSQPRDDDMDADLVLQRSLAVSSLAASSASMPGGGRATGVAPLQLPPLPLSARSEVVPPLQMSARTEAVQPLTARSTGAQPLSARSNVLQPRSLAAHGNVAAAPVVSPPKQQQQQQQQQGMRQSREGGWGTGYLSKFQARAYRVGGCLTGAVCEQAAAPGTAGMCTQALTHTPTATPARRTTAPCSRAAPASDRAASWARASW